MMLITKVSNWSNQEVGNSVSSVEFRHLLSMPVVYQELEVGGEEHG